MPSLEVSAPCGGHPPLNRERDMRRNGTRGAKTLHGLLRQKQAIAPSALCSKNVGAGIPKSSGTVSR